MDDSLDLRARHAAPQEEETYFASMADLMTGILFVFIIVLMSFAISYRQAEDTRRTAVEEVARLKDARAQLLHELVERLHAAGVTAQVDLAHGVLRLPNDLLFPRGSAELTPDASRTLAVLAGAMTGVVPCYLAVVPAAGCPANAGGRLETVLIEGHTDSDVIHGGPFRSNDELSAARALATYRALVADAPALATLKGQQGAALIGFSGYGANRPIADNSTDAGKQANRRIDIRFIMAAPEVGDVKAIETKAGVKP